ncbi:MAG: hypothetical protein QM520_00170 [Gammaproteobacteria bacterium]|nr:hypothetical protein [Gammaproteobacteria bacterium]
MLSFTFDKEGCYKGIYNGRFVFHAPDASESYSDNYLHLIAEGKAQALYEDVFRHEFFHWLAFRASPFGITTIGRRFRARTEFLIGNELEVMRYYQQRTAYFCCCYKAHEEIVGQLESCISDKHTHIRKVKLNKTQINTIAVADNQAIKATLELDAHQPTFSSIVDYIKGRVASSEFGLQAHIRDANDKIKLREVSLKSMTFWIFNAAFEEKLGNQNLIIQYIKRIRREFNREKRIGGSRFLNNPKMARWAVLKFTTEAKTLRQLKNLGYPTPFSFEEYCFNIASFAHRHTLNADIIMERHLALMIKSCAEYSGDQTLYADLVDKFECIDEPILYFFYVHGN